VVELDSAGVVVVGAARGVVLEDVVKALPKLNGVVVVAGFVSKELVSGEATVGAVVPPILNGVVPREN